MVYVKLGYTALHMAMVPNHVHRPALLLLMLITPLRSLTNDCAVYGGTSGGESICQNNSISVREDKVY